MGEFENLGDGISELLSVATVDKSRGNTGCDLGSDGGECLAEGEATVVLGNGLYGIRIVVRGGCVGGWLCCIRWGGFRLLARFKVLPSMIGKAL